MSERELGSMQIANERIVITEVPISQESIVVDGVVKSVAIERRSPFMDKDAYTPFLHEQRGGIIQAEWYAETMEGKVVAWAMIVHGLDGPDTVILFACVTTPYRRLGLGKFMIRLGTDQAIRYRKRTILAEVANTNTVALAIAEDEEFEKQPEAHPGFTLLRKELKWL